MSSTHSEPPSLTRVKAGDTSAEELAEILKRDGGVIVESFISTEAAEQLRNDLKPAFAADAGDSTGFFPSTTRRATGLLGISDGFVKLATHPLYNEVASLILTSKYTYWLGQERHTSISRPQISSTVAFQVNPGSKQQGLHRDEIDYHTREGEEPMMMGAVTAVMRTTKANGATVVIPGSHKWSGERCPQEHETVAAELEPGDTLMFLGNVYHAGGANTTTYVPSTPRPETRHTDLLPLLGTRLARQQEYSCVRECTGKSRTSI